MIASEIKSKAQRFVSFDGSTQIDAAILRPSKSNFFARGEEIPRSIARGAGLSYAAASFGREVLSIDQSLLNKVIDFNPGRQWIEVEPGMSLGQLYDFLIEENLFLATQPGHPRISIGGCIAPDIHGKNQFLDGTFINQVLSLKLFHPAHGVVELSPEKDPELFRLTCGGYGLTGNIISCRLALKKIPSAFAEVSLQPLKDIKKLPERLRQSAANADFVLSWHDFTQSGNGFGSGFIQEGRFRKGNSSEQPNKSKKAAAAQSLDAATRGDMPIRVFNSLSVKLMNMYYGSRCGSNGANYITTLFESIFPIQNTKELYFKFFGKAGFHEYQVVVPEQNFCEYIESIKSYLSKNPLPITLASAKLFAGKQDLLRFSGSGICFAINFPRSASSPDFLNYLDALILRVGAIPNIIKDSRLSRQTIAAAYPEYELFRQQLREFDPKRTYASELSERLAL